MGIDDFKVAPDNPGGRPPKEEQEEEDSLREVYGDPYSPDKSDADWWQEKLDEALASGEIPTDNFNDFIKASSIVADWVHISTIEVLKQLKKEEVIEFDWEWVREEAPDEWKDLRWPKKARYEVFEVEGSSTEDEEYTGGLASLVDEAKKSE